MLKVWGTSKRPKGIMWKWFWLYTSSKGVKLVDSWGSSQKANRWYCIQYRSLFLSPLPNFSGWSGLGTAFLVPNDFSPRYWVRYMDLPGLFIFRPWSDVSSSVPDNSSRVDLMWAFNLSKAKIWVFVLPTKSCGSLLCRVNFFALLRYSLLQ